MPVHRRPATDPQQAGVMNVMPTRQSLELVCTGTRFDLGSGSRLVSVILPIKNRARNARALLSRIYAQRCDASLEIIAVDSGSSDDTVEVLAEGGATVYTVAASEFDYGLTRNAAARHAQGQVLLFVTSTMLPADNSWLGSLLAALDADERLAGVYSRGIPRPDADILNYRDYLRADARTNRREASLIRDGVYIRAAFDGGGTSSLPPDRRRHLISFSNVSAAIRADVFRRIPFQSVSSCGEDMLWARDVLDAGHTVAYTTASIVLYSHNYSWTELFRRSFDDSAGNAAFVGQTVESASVVPRILASIRDDWNYLAHGCLLTGPELVHWKVQSVIRRCVQVVGQWLGSRYSESRPELDAMVDALAELPGGERAMPERRSDAGLPMPATSELQSCSYGRLAVAAFRDSPCSYAPARALASELEKAVTEDWARLQHQMRDDPDLVELQLDLAVRRFASLAGSWVTAAVGPRGPHIDSKQLSLLEGVKAGEQMAEMMTPSPLDLPVRRDWTGDVEAFRRFAEAGVAEILAAEQELDERARVIGRMYSDVLQRDELIRALQRELHEKVGERDAVIRTLQSQMDCRPRTKRQSVDSD
jgi:glycosyltransferase involved in cell wall biosynthesis